jgi:hypothetical protein
MELICRKASSTSFRKLNISSIVGSVLDLKKTNQIKSNQIQNIQRFDLDLKSFLTQ